METAFALSLTALFIIILAGFLLVRRTSKIDPSADHYAHDEDDEEPMQLEGGIMPRGQGRGRRRREQGQNARPGRRRRGWPGREELEAFRHRPGDPLNGEGGGGGGQPMMQLEDREQVEVRNGRDLRESQRRARAEANAAEHQRMDEAWEKERLERARREVERARYGHDEDDPPCTVSEAAAAGLGVPTALHLERVKGAVEGMVGAGGAVHVEVLATYTRLKTREVLAVLRHWKGGGFVDSLGYFHPSVDRAYVEGVVREARAGGREGNVEQLLDARMRKQFGSAH